VVIEQYISGREIQVGVLDGKPLPSIEIRPKTGFYDYKNKYQPGAAEEITPSPIPAEAEERVGSATVTVYEALRLKSYSRADFIYDDAGDFWFLEINTLPGMTPTSLVPQEAAVVGYTYSSICARRSSDFAEEVRMTGVTVSESAAHRRSFRAGRRRRNRRCHRQPRGLSGQPFRGPARRQG
jgi:D-alanine--D-alanine ligase